MEVSRTQLQQCSGSAEQLLDCIKLELKDFARHVYFANWQKREKKRIIEDDGEVCLIIDFSENFAVSYDEEVSSLHWDKAQVTRHKLHKNSRRCKNYGSSLFRL